MSYLDEFGLSLVHMPSDGNCLFHSFTYHLTNYALGSLEFVNHSRDLRHRVVTYIQSNIHHYHPFLVGKYLAFHQSLPPAPTLIEQEKLAVRDYLLEMSKDGVYADEESIDVISRLFKVEFKVLQREGGNVLTFGTGNQPTFYLLRTRLPEHYDVLIESGQSQVCIFLLLFVLSFCVIL